MIRSVRYFLLISLLISITIASSITAIGNYMLDRKILSPLLDDQLYKTYSLLKFALQHAAENPEARKNISERLDRIAHSGPRKLFFTVMSPDNKILFHSEEVPSIPHEPLKHGFNDVRINHMDWRIYSGMVPATNNRIFVAESYETRDGLIDHIARNNIYILILTYPFFGLVVWLIVIIALRSVTRVTEEISNRSHTSLEPVPTENIPIEIQPLVSELNQLFLRVKIAFNRSRRFAGDAAHELRTPLAAIKTQAQVALRSEQPTERQESLQKVIQGVNRSSHIINQLLTLSRLGHEEELNDTAPLDLHRLATESVASLIPAAREKNISVTLEPAPSRRHVTGNDIALDILMRNIIDNAIRYTPRDGTIHIEIVSEGNHIIFEVTDSGPGIPPELRKNVFGRFYRIIGNQAQGSGLGLAIVLQIAKLHQADIVLDTPKTGTGLIVRVVFPASTEKHDS